MASSSCFAQLDDMSESVEYSNNLTATTLLQSLKSPTTTPFSLPTIKSLDINDQVRALFVEVNDLPIVDIQLTFNAGSARDESIESGLFGLANTTARLFNNGNVSAESKMQLQSLQSLGAQYSVQAYRDMFVVKLRVMSEPNTLNKAIYHLTSLLKTADFPQNRIAQLWSNAQVGQRQIAENPTSAMNVRLYRTLYNQHPYAEPTTGTAQSLKRIQAHHLQKFQRTYLVKQNVNLAITGNVSEQRATEIANTILTKLENGSKATEIPLVDTPRTHQIIQMPFNANQAYVLLGHLNVPRAHPDRISLEVGNHILGGSGFNSLLMKELRETNGYTYSVSSQISSMQAQGIFTIGYSTERKNLNASLDLSYKTLFDFIYRPLELKTVESTKISMINAFPQSVSSNASINAQLGLIGFYNLPDDYFQQYLAKLQTITPEEIQQAWQKHIRPETLNTIVAGQDIKISELQTIYENQINTIEKSTQEKPHD